MTWLRTKNKSKRKNGSCFADGGAARSPSVAASRVALLAGLPAWLATFCACGSNESGTSNAHPPELIGRWIRLEDSAVVDTLEFRADGTVYGSRFGQVPKGATWYVRGAPLARLFCASDSRRSSCQTYSTDGELLRLGGGPGGHTIFRRLR